MKVLLDITHPLHVHLFKNLIFELQDRGIEVMVLSRNKDLTVPLLDAYDIDHTVITQRRTGVGLGLEWAYRTLKTISVVRSFNPDVLVSRFNVSFAAASMVLGTPLIVFEQNERDTLLSSLVYYNSNVICTPRSLETDLGKPQIRYNGYHELAYLHPNWFTPDRNALEEHGVNVDDPYVVCRFVSWDAHHDIGESHAPVDAKQDLVDELSQHATVYVSAEDQPDAFADQVVPIPPELMHQLLYFADLHVGDSGTMPIESALLGTPAICTNHLAREMGVFKELESKYGAVFLIEDRQRVVNKATELLGRPGVDEEWSEKRAEIMSDKDDLTEFMVDVLDKEVE